MLANLKLLACNSKANLIITEKLFLTNRLVFSFCENWKQNFYTCSPPPPYFTLYPTWIPNRFCVCLCVCVCVPARARARAYQVRSLGSCISGTFVFTLTTQVLRTLCLDIKDSHPRASINSELLTCHTNCTTGSEFRIFIWRFDRPKSAMSIYGVRRTSIPACQHTAGSTGIPPCQYMVLGVPAYQPINTWCWEYSILACSNMVLGVPALRHINTIYGAGSTGISPCQYMV